MNFKATTDEIKRTTIKMTESNQNKVIFHVPGTGSLDRKRRSSSTPEEDISHIISHVESRACEASVASDISALTDGEFFSVSSVSKNKNFRTMARAPEPPTVTQGTSKLTDIQSETTATTETSSSKDEKSPKSRSKRSVSFCEVQIREYERILGFNPSVTSGPAVGIGWNYSPQSQVFTIEKFEESREFKRCHSSDEYALSRDERERLLRYWGFTKREIATSVRSILRTKNQRKQTVQNLHAANYEEFVEKAKRKVKHVFLLPLHSQKKAKKPYTMISSHKHYESSVLQKATTPSIIYSSAA